VIARVLRVDVSPEQIDAGRVEIIGIWESANAVSEVAPTLEPARQRLWDQFGSNPQLEIYDVADDLR
jgi:hypothetical protein